MSDEPKTISEWVRAAHSNAVQHGWWHTAVAPSTGDILTKIALMHSELSEAVEEVREGRLEMCARSVVSRAAVSDTELIASGAKPEGAVVELADCVIRIFDLCGALGLDLEAAIKAKHAYNVTRPFRHGNKKA